MLLRSDRLRLRPVQQGDLDELYRQFNTLEHRGAYFPMGLQAEPVFRRRFEETGFWSKTEGMLLMAEPHGAIVGEIEYYPITDFLTGWKA